MTPRAGSHSSRRLAAVGFVLGVLWLPGGAIESSPSVGREDARAFWRVGVPRPIAVRGGRARFRVPTSGPRSQTAVIVSALARDRGPYPIRLTARPATSGAVPDLADDGPRRPPRSLPTRSAPPVVEAVGIPPRERWFHLLADEGDPGVSGNYAAVRGILAGVGRRVQVYVSAEDVVRASRATIREIILTFDDRIYPRACEHGPPARDVDGDGRLTVLLSRRLEHLGEGRQAVDGFVKVADLDTTVPSPFGNRCDMIYLNAGLRAGPYLRTVLAHEYMHAVAFTRKTLDPSDGTGPGPEEEAWLDEAIAHIAEDFHGFSPSNIDYRVSAYLSAPERYALVIDDYFAAKLFRSHGHRGSTYLFLRWCVDRCGPELIDRLVGSPLRGVANVEESTGSTFADLFRRWTVAIFRSGLDPTDPSGDGYRTTDLRAPWAGGELAGPRYRPMTPGGPSDGWDASGTSAHYVVIDGDAAGAIEVEVEGPATSGLQVTAIPMGDDRARLSLSIRASRGPDGVLMAWARVTEGNGVPVRLSGLSWEPLVPSGPGRVDGRPRGRLDMLGIADAFGTSALPTEGGLESGPIPMPGITDRAGTFVVKLVGTDPLGRRVSAWADLDIGPPDRTARSASGVAGPPH